MTTQRRHGSAGRRRRLGPGTDPSSGAAGSGAAFLMSVANHSMLIMVSAMFALPFLFVILTSLMTTDQALTTDLWPRSFVWNELRGGVRRLPVFRAFNTMTIAILSTVGVLVSSIPVAYALARMRWRGRNAAFIVILATIMLPYQVTIVPLPCSRATGGSRRSSR